MLPPPESPCATSSDCTSLSEPPTLTRSRTTPARPAAPTRDRPDAGWSGLVRGDLVVRPKPAPSAGTADASAASAGAPPRVRRPGQRTTRSSPAHSTSRPPRAHRGRGRGAKTRPLRAGRAPSRGPPPASSTRSRPAAPPTTSRLPVTSWARSDPPEMRPGSIGSARRPPAARGAREGPPFAPQIHILPIGVQHTGDRGGSRCPDPRRPVVGLLARPPAPECARRPRSSAPAVIGAEHRLREERTSRLPDLPAGSHPVLADGPGGPARLQAPMGEVHEGRRPFEQADVRTSRSSSALERHRCRFLPPHVTTRQPDGKTATEVMQETDVLFRRLGAWKVVHLHYSPAKKE